MITKFVNFERKQRNATPSYQNKIRQGALNCLQPKSANCSHNNVNQKSKMKNKKGFTLVEVLIAVVIIGLASSVSFSIWKSNLQKSHVDNATHQIISMFQAGRSYAIKNVQVEGEINTLYYINQVSDGVFQLSGDVSPSVIETWDISDVASVSPSTWSVYYEAPYGDFVIESVGGVPIDGDLEFTVTSSDGSLSREIVVHKLSGIAEER